VFYWPAVIRRAVIDTIDGACPQDTAFLVRALVTGDRSGFSETFTDDVAVSGLSHVFAVSGMHVSVLVGVLLAILGGRRRAAFIALPVILLFLCAAGFTPSAMRAAVMQSLLLLAPLLKREYEPATALCTALALLAAINPYALADVGLQLSFLSTAAILLCSKRIEGALTARLARGSSEARPAGRVRRYLISTLGVTLSALLFTTPLTAYYFGRVSLVAPLANLLALWAVTGLFVVGIVATAAGLVWLPVGALLGWVAWPFARWLEVVVGAMASLPFAALETKNVLLPVWLLLLYVTVVFCVWKRLPAKRLIAPACSLALTLALSVALPAFAASDESLTVRVLDVGQGQCLLLSSGGRTALIDCGGPNSPGHTAIRAINAYGLSAPDTIILTHLHADHVSGVPTVIERLGCQTMVLPADADDPDDLLSGIEAAAEMRGVALLYLTREWTFAFGRATIRLMPLSGSGADANERGLAALCSVGGYDLLVTGDMPASMERELIVHYGLPHIETLIVGHHGSRRSTCAELLRMTNPESAVISVGRNSYGHPSPETLERLNRIGVFVTRTDLSGDVTIRVNPNH